MMVWVPVIACTSLLYALASNVYFTPSRPLVVRRLGKMRPLFSICKLHHFANGYRSLGGYPGLSITFSSEGLSLPGAASDLPRSLKSQNYRANNSFMSRLYSLLISSPTNPYGDAISLLLFFCFALPNKKKAKCTSRKFISFCSAFSGLHLAYEL